MELVDVVDSKSTAGDSVPVRVRPPAPKRSASPTGMRTFLAWMVPTSKQRFDARPQAGVSERNRRLRRHLARRRRPPAPRRSKVRFAPTSFYAYGKKDVIRPLPCSSFPNRTRCAGLRFDFGWKPGSIGIYTVVIFQLVANDISLCDEFFHFIAKLIARSFCCSSIPNRTRCRWAPVWGRRFAAVLSDLEKYRF